MVLIKLNQKKIPRKKKQKVEESLKTEQPSSEESGLEIDSEGVTEPKTDTPEEMGARGHLGC